MDAIDKKILALLQEDATLTVNELAGQVGFSPNPCWRRVQRLEAEGVIRKRVTLLNAAALNAGVTVFVAIKTSQHSAAWFKGFEERECHSRGDGVLPDERRGGPPAACGGAGHCGV